MEYYYGQICVFPYIFVPRGWKLCNGELLQISQNQVLFSLIGTKFGGNGTTNFALPNLQGAEPEPGTGYYICVEGVYPSRS
ncbi:tail fiber protein [Lachnospiraceae bacterium MD1]|jgi:microcystin-dependent protein|uniref:Tail fiber protein n=1 Tax=Variimorphobacter saccharofermentans TaxID=2755051 RepID=A0A839K0I7_9FIRM|nr:tail fiber protein [Variimorphobacter saccharofermentans]MBB2182439.1 tail fiber protein [Variimorphobacter saccharofermentans]